MNSNPLHSVVSGGVHFMPCYDEKMDGFGCPGKYGY